jgi:guanine deaminase
MTETLLRGRVLDIRDEPQGPEDRDAWRLIEDGGILIEAGRIVEAGDFAALKARAPDAAVTDHRPHLLMPGLIDTHIHFPQVQVIASWGAQLLDWLDTYTFPAETRFADPRHCERMAVAFHDEMLRHGTTTAVAYCSVHAASAEAYFAEAERRGMAMLGGKVLMDRNAPDGLRDTPRSGYDDTKALIGKWHGRGRARYAISPRFAITSSPEQMEACGALVREHPECHVQTHLAENHAEIAFTAELYPEARDYLDVYERHGLLGPRSLFGHCIHLRERERAALAETGSVAVFCPTSNLFLGSGLYDYEGLRGQGIRTAIATDVGGGTSYSMLRTLDEGYKALQLRNQSLHPLRAFYWATLGNARALGLEHEIGSLAPGSAADIVVLDAGATPAMALRMETVETIAEELFVLQTLGDDRAIAETYVTGVASKPRQQADHQRGVDTVSRRAV